MYIPEINNRIIGLDNVNAAEATRAPKNSEPVSPIKILAG